MSNEFHSEAQLDAESALSHTENQTSWVLDRSISHRHTYQDKLLVTVEIEINYNRNNDQSHFLHGEPNKNSRINPQSYQIEVKQQYFHIFNLLNFSESWGFCATHSCITLFFFF